MAWDLAADTAVGLAGSSLVVSLALLNILPRRGGVVVFLVGVVWYWTSAVWAAVTKEILADLKLVVYPSTSIWLTFLPQALSYILVQILALVAGADLCEGTCFRSKAGLRMGTWQLAGAAYFFGQLFTVAALALDAPSLVFVVKAVEPLSTALLAIPVLNQHFNLRLFLAILVACSGIMLTAVASHGGLQSMSAPNVYLCMALGMLANIGFSSRACVAKRALVYESKEPLEAYGKLTVAATQSGFVLLFLWLAVGHCVMGDGISIFHHLRKMPGAWFTASLTYFLYQGSSILLLSYFMVETHALLVALKHVFVVVLASLMTGSVLNASMIMGLLVVSAGVGGYVCSPEEKEKEPLLPTKAVPTDGVSYLLVTVVISVVALGTVLPLWQL